MKLYVRNVLMTGLTVAMTATMAVAQFSKPTDEELKMTSDPKAPGASAVYLYREETTNDLVHFHTYMARVKVLTEKGKELATVRIPYEKGKFEVAAIQGRTIHSDGTILPLKAKPADLLNYKNSEHQYNEMVFTLPGVEVGSILEYYLQLRYSEDTVSEPEWIIQQPYFVHKAHYFFTPTSYAIMGVTDKHNQVVTGLGYATRLDGVATVSHDTMNRYKLDVTDVPALPDQDYMPPLNTLRWRVVFYYTNANSSDEFWNAEGKYWARDTDRFASVSGAIKKAAAGMVGGGDSEEQKARKIYDAVMKLNNRDYLQMGGKLNGAHSKDASNVWKLQSGTGDELALLYVALARAAGLQAWPMQVVNRNTATFDKNYLYSEQLDDYLAVVSIDGKEVYLDPGQKYCPFGTLHWKHQVATGLRQNARGVTLETTPVDPPKNSNVDRFADLKVEEDGAVQGEIRLTMTGAQALYWRQRSLSAESKDVAKEFSDDIDEDLPQGVHAELDHFDALEDGEAPLVLHAKVKGSLGSATGKRLILPELFFQARVKQPFVQDSQRQVPVDLHYARMEQDEVHYHLPAMLHEDQLPTIANEEWKNHDQLRVTIAREKDELVVRRAFVQNIVVLDANEYGSLRYFYQKKASAEQQEILLTRQASQGN